VEIVNSMKELPDYVCCGLFSVSTKATEKSMNSVPKVSTTQIFTHVVVTVIVFEKFKILADVRVL
jgi:hypothetical protein